MEAAARAGGRRELLDAGAVAGWMLAALGALATGCTGGGLPGPFDGPDTVVLRRMPAAPQAVADCLRTQTARVAYPQDVAPYATAVVTVPEGLVVEQWFSLGVDAQWVTRYRLRPVAGGRTDVRVTMDLALPVAHGYARAAAELVDWCATAAGPG